MSARLWEVHPGQEGGRVDHRARPHTGSSGVIYVHRRPPSRGQPANMRDVSDWEPEVHLGEHGERETGGRWEAAPRPGTADEVMPQQRLQQLPRRSEHASTRLATSYHMPPQQSGSPQLYDHSYHVPHGDRHFHFASPPSRHKTAHGYPSSFADAPADVLAHFHRSPLLGHAHISGYGADVSVLLGQAEERAEISEERAEALERELRETQSRLLDAQQGFQQQQNSMQTLDERNKSLQAELREAIHTTSVLAAGYKERSDQLILALERARQERDGVPELDTSVSDPGKMAAGGLVRYSAAPATVVATENASPASDLNRLVSEASDLMQNLTDENAELMLKSLYDSNTPLAQCTRQILKADESTTNNQQGALRATASDEHSAIAAGLQQPTCPPSVMWLMSSLDANERAIYSELDGDGIVSDDDLRGYLAGHDGLTQGTAKVRVDGVILHKHYHVSKPHAGINGDYVRSEDMYNGRAIYVKESGQGTIMWWANINGAMNWCVGPRSTSTQSERREIWACVVCFGPSPDYAGTRPWSVYSHSSQKWEKQFNVEVLNIEVTSATVGRGPRDKGYKAIALELPMRTTIGVHEAEEDIRGGSTQTHSSEGSKATRRARSWNVTPATFQEVAEWNDKRAGTETPLEEIERNGRVLENTVVYKIKKNSETLCVLGFLLAVTVIGTLQQISLWLAVLQLALMFGASLKWEEDQWLARGRGDVGIGQYRACRLFCQFLIVLLLGLTTGLMLWVSVMRATFVDDLDS